MRWRAYYSVLKPERTLANVITTVAGYLFASRWHIEWLTFAAVVGGTSLVVASACAANNCTDRELDARMPRTSKRALVTGQVPLRVVAGLAVLLGVAGFVLLIVGTNWLTVLLGAIGYIDYVVLYAWSKRRTPYSTLIGTISGAIPLMAGYTAASGQLDGSAWLLGLMMVAWQMAHFYAIGIFRHKDYQVGGLPIWPVRYGDNNTRNWIIGFAALFLICSLALGFTGGVGALYLAGMTLIGVWWLYVAFGGLKSSALTAWARRMFGVSLVVVLVMSALLSIATVTV